MTSPDSALVLFSGGQDSTVCLAWALARYAHVETIGFDYGQRHHVELQARQTVLKRLKAGQGSGLDRWSHRLGDDHVLRLPALATISDTALTRQTTITMTEAGLPSTFVPGRNLLFLTYAAALAYRRGLGTLVGGMCETDFSGYPDCRRATLDALTTALSLGMDKPLEIITPLMRLDKAATWQLADELGGSALTALIIEETHTCYLGVRDRHHDWGRGCDDCPACELRRKGWEQWQQSQAAVG
ncbi:MAG: 7-cyano-7-deazaguanine synthase QueC [Pseudomonadota bacterium]